MTRSLLRMILSALVLLSARDAGAAGRPKVLVRFEASGTQFSGLDATARNGLAAHVAEQVRAACAKNWRFVEWEAASSAPAPSGAAWTWLVRVDEEMRNVTLPNGQAATDSIVRLRHLVSAAGATGTPWELETPRATLYDYGVPKPSGAGSIQRDLDGLIERQFTGEFLDKVGANFLKQVQLGDTIVVDAVGQRVIVPLRRCELHAGEKSQLEVRFKKHTAAGTVIEGVLALEAFRVVEAGNNVGCIYGPVLILDFPPDRLTPNNYWDARFPGILGSIHDVRVYMLKYQAEVADAGLTSEGVILDPDPCGEQP